MSMRLAACLLTSCLLLHVTLALAGGGDAEPVRATVRAGDGLREFAARK